MAAMFLVALVGAVGSGCSYSGAPANGGQRCAPAGGKRCPDGYFCAADNTCWRDGTSPSDAGTPNDGQPNDGQPYDSQPNDAPIDRFMAHEAGPAPSSHAVVPGGTRSSSASYSAVRTAGQSPGGNRVSSSQSYWRVGGLVGATQK